MQQPTGSHHGEAGELAKWEDSMGVPGNPMDEAGLTVIIQKVAGEPEGRPKPQMQETGVPSRTWTSQGN